MASLARRGGRIRDARRGGCGGSLSHSLPQRFWPVLRLGFGSSSKRITSRATRLHILACRVFGDIERTAQGDWRAPAASAAGADSPRRGSCGFITASCTG